MPRATVLLAVLALAAAPASAAAAGLGPPAEPPDPSIVDGSAQRALSAARARWRLTGSSTYALRVRRVCFCVPEARRAAWILVVAGRPHGAPEHLREAATVPRLHRIVQNAITARVAGLEVRYDARGVPREVDVDRSRGIADEEVGYRVEGVRAPR